MTEDFARRVSGIGALAEPARRALYQYVASQPGAVSRDQAARATGVALAHRQVPPRQARRRGPARDRVPSSQRPDRTGAGRPSKLYRRAAGEVSVSLPERRYDLAGQIFAAAIERTSTTGGPVLDAVAQEAAATGRALAAQARTAADGSADPAAADPGAVDPGALDRGASLEPIVTVLAENGYEPREVDGTVVMANCPFHALATDHTDLVCGLNLELLTALTDGLGRPDLQAVLDPAPGRCCVVLRRTPPAPPPT